MGRANPIAAVYMVLNTLNHKYYIGETKSITDRFSYYRSTKQRGEKYATRPIDKAILKHGIEAFVMYPLITSINEPRLVDVKFRRKMEAKYIKQYHATDPNYGYNEEDKNNKHSDTVNRMGFTHTPRTKMLKSDPLLVYDPEDNGVTLYFGSESCAKLLGISDRSIIVHCMKTGYSNHGRVFAKLDYQKRYDVLKRLVSKQKDIADGKCKDNGSVTKCLNSYLNAMKYMNEFCARFGYEQVHFEDVVREVYGEYKDT